ncbi:MAG: hypothetical protein LBJ46_07260 [Planctomycetota bacterium]|jgi:hypothetical protein|nr:hypothetical protein [Planctomycetota bacterium]
MKRGTPTYPGGIFAVAKDAGALFLICLYRFGAFLRDVLLLLLVQHSAVVGMTTSVGFAILGIIACIASLPALPLFLAAHLARGLAAALIVHAGFYVVFFTILEYPALKILRRGRGPAPPMSRFRNFASRVRAAMYAYLLLFAGFHFLHHHFFWREDLRFHLVRRAADTDVYGPLCDSYPSSEDTVSVPSFSMDRFLPSGIANQADLDQFMQSLAFSPITDRVYASTPERIRGSGNWLRRANPAPHPDAQPIVAVYQKTVYLPRRGGFFPVYPRVFVVTIAMWDSSAAYCDAVMLSEYNEFMYD